MKRDRASILPVFRLVIGLAILCLSAKAQAIDYNFAGSVSINYKTLLNHLSEPREQRDLMLAGFNVNAAIKAVVDVSPYLSATAKMCYACHGFEALNLYAELTPHPAFNVRAGRLQPSFGDFYLRHDPTSHKTPDNPLPYDMGHMVQGGVWGYGVFPVPYVDNGLEIYGTLRPADTFSIYYSTHVVSGFKGAAPPAQNPQLSPPRDFSYRRMRFVTATDYLVDNNRWPSFGGRLALTFARSGDMSPAVPDITLGASAMYGLWDDDDRLSYLIYGVDLYIHFWRINLRAEVLRRQQTVDPRLLEFRDPMPMVTGPNTLLEPPTIYKDGFYVESDFPLGGYLEGVLRVDGMRRAGPRPARANPDDEGKPANMRSSYSAPGSAALDFEDWVMRYTVGLNVIPITGTKVKLAYEHYTFKTIPEKDDPFRASRAAKFQTEYLLHLAVVASF